MPELPEVELARRCWERWAAGRTVRAVSGAASRVLRPRGPRALQALRGAKFSQFDRRGKNLLFTARRQGEPLGLWSLKQFEHAVGPEGDIAYVEEPGTPNPFAVYDRAGERCPRCRKGTIERIVQAGRSTFFCPLCQR